MTLAAWITVAGLVLVGSTGSGGIVYWLLNRKSQERLDKKVDRERENLEAQAVAAWHALWNQNAQGAYDALDRRCNRCETNLGKVCALFAQALADVASHLRDPGSVDLDRMLIVAQRELAKYTPD